MQTAVELDFADGRYNFKLTLEGVSEIQRKCKAGIGAVFARVLSGRYFPKEELSVPPFGNPAEARFSVEDLLEIVRQGLIGGEYGYADDKRVEMDASLANRLIANYLFPVRPIKHAWDLAAAIIMASYEGMDDPEEHPVKKKGDSVKPSRTGDGLTTGGRSQTSPSATSRRPKRKG